MERYRWPDFRLPYIFNNGLVDRLEVLALVLVLTGLDVEVQGVLVLLVEVEEWVLLWDLLVLDRLAYKG